MPLMQPAQTIGIDLPLKVLVWQDAAGRTWLACNEPDWLAHRHSVDSGTGHAMAAMTKASAAIASSATGGMEEKPSWRPG